MTHPFQPLPAGRNYGLSALHEAVRCGDTALVRMLMRAGVDPLERDECGMTALRLAARLGRRGMVAVMRKGAEIRALSVPLTLHKAAEHGLLAKVVQLIRSGSDVNAPSPEGKRPLRIAAQKGHRDVVQALINAGADPYADLEEAVQPAQPFRDLIWLGAAVDPLLPLPEERTLSSATEADAAFEAVPRFVQSSQEGRFRAAVSLVEDCAGVRAREWRGQPGVMMFHESRAEQILSLQIRRSGFHLISQNSNLLLFPTACKFAVIAACGTSGSNYGLTTRQLVRSLIEFDRASSFDLLGCGSDWLEGQLAQRKDAEGANDVLRRLSALSPDVASDPTERAHAVRQLGCTGRFRLWWD